MFNQINVMKYIVMNKIQATSNNFGLTLYGLQTRKILFGVFNSAIRLFPGNLTDFPWVKIMSLLYTSLKFVSLIVFKLFIVVSIYVSSKIRTPDIYKN